MGIRGHRAGVSRGPSILGWLSLIGALVVPAAVPLAASAATTNDKPSISLHAKLVGQECRLKIRVQDAPKAAKAQLQRKDGTGWHTVATKKVGKGSSRWRRACVPPAGSRVRAHLLRKKRVIAHSKGVRQPRPPDLDTTPPSTTIVSGPSGPTTDASPTFVFSANEDPVTFECRLGPQDAPGSFGPCSTPTSHTPASPLGDGSYRFEVRATDAAGNTGAPAARDFTVELPGCFDNAVPAHEGNNAGDLSSNACAQGEGGDAQAPCQAFAGGHQWWSFEIPAGETAEFQVSPSPNLDDVGIALYTANNDAGRLACQDTYGPGTAETVATTNAGASTLTVYVQIFAVAGQEGTYTLSVNSLNCFASAQPASEGNNAGDLSSGSCANAGEAESYCETGGGRHQWWSFAVPAGKTTTFTATPDTGDDIGIALFTANSDASLLACKDMFGPGYAETTSTTNPGASAMTVYIQIFALPGQEGPYTLNVATSP